MDQKMQMFHIVGCNHGIQVGDSGFAALDSADQNEQRAHFRQMLEQIYLENGIQVLLEEDGAPEMTSGEQLADRYGISWADINTSNEDKDRMSIPRDYMSGKYTEEQRNGWNRQREDFMVGRIDQHRGDAERAMVICGFDHLKPLAQMLRANGFEVRTWDYRLLDWYRPEVFHT